MAAAGNGSEIEAGLYQDKAKGLEDRRGARVSIAHSPTNSRRASAGTPHPESQRSIFGRSPHHDRGSQRVEFKQQQQQQQQSRNKAKRKERGRKSPGNTFTFEGYGDDDDDEDVEDEFVEAEDVDSQLDQPISVRVDSEDDAEDDDVMEEQEENENLSWSFRCTSFWTSVLEFLYSLCTCNARKSERSAPASDMETTGSSPPRRRTLRHKLKPRVIGSRISLGEGAESGAKRDTRPRGRAKQSCYEIIQKLSKWTSAREFFTLHAVRFVAITAGLAYSTLILFTRHLYGVVHAFFGLMFSMEAYNGAMRRDRKLVLYYALALVLSAIVSILIGTTLLNQSNFECFLAENPDTCSSVQFAWGTISVLMAIGEGAAAFVVFVAWSNMRTRREIEREHFQRKHEHSVAG